MDWLTMGVSDQVDLTILSTPKAFRGIFRTIQRNAIRSWTELSPRPDIILFGTDEGTREICEELGIVHVPDVRKSPEGTPLLSDMFITGQHLATTPMVMWSNADMIYTDHLMEAARSVRCLPQMSYVVGQRTDIDQQSPLDFHGCWQADLLETARAHGELKPVNWIDYFMFTRGLFVSLPDFAIGRPGYDPWLIWKAASLGATVVDATPFIPAIHQRHDYSHVGSREDVFNGVEAARNAAIVDDWRHYHSIIYARHRLNSSGEIVPASGLRYLVARPRTYIGHVLRFVRPLRRRLLGERATRRRSTPA